MGGGSLFDKMVSNSSFQSFRKNVLQFDNGVTTVRNVLKEEMLNQKKSESSQRESNP